MLKMKPTIRFVGVFTLVSLEGLVALEMFSEPPRKGPTVEENVYDPRFLFSFFPMPTFD